MWYGTGVSSWSLSLLSTKPPWATPCSVFAAAIVAVKSIVARPPGAHVHVGGLIFIASHSNVALSATRQLPLLLPVTSVTVIPGPAAHQKLLMNPTLLRFCTSSVYLSPP